MSRHGPGYRRRRRPRHMRLAPLLLGFHLAACGADSPRAVTVERSDSAGVTVVRSLGPDVPLDWTFTPTLVLGGEDEGPESFFDIGERSVATDAAGNLYVLDRGNHRIVVFEGEGRQVRTMGREGAGPGELQLLPTGIEIGRDGAVHVYDFGKRGLVRFAADGTPLATRTIDVFLEAGRWEFAGEGLLVETASGPLDERLGHLLSIDEDGDTATVAAFPSPPLRSVDFGCVRISGLPPLFAPSLVWTAADSVVAVSGGAEYRIDLYRGTRLAVSLRRDVEPRPATRDLALREVGDDYAVTFGSGKCPVPAARVVDERGVAEVLPAIRSLAIAPDGAIWARRFAVRGEPASIDVFAPDGAYLGTLPAGSPFPATFFPDGRLATVEVDELDVPRVVVYRVDR